MQSENGILLLFYIFLSHGNERKKMKKGGWGIKALTAQVVVNQTTIRS
jgi:hypothetical protein